MKMKIVVTVAAAFLAIASALPAQVSIPPKPDTVRVVKKTPARRVVHPSGLAQAHDTTTSTERILITKPEESVTAKPAAPQRHFRTVEVSVPEVANLDARPHRCGNVLSCHWKAIGSAAILTGGLGWLANRQGWFDNGKHETNIQNAVIVNANRWAMLGIRIPIR